jgi:hypothetical protein
MSKVKRKHEAADTTQWPKEKEQKDKRIKIVQIEQPNPTQIGGTLGFSERVSSSCSNGGTRCVIVNDPVAGHERENYEFELIFDTRVHTMSRVPQ